MHTRSHPASPAAKALAALLLCSPLAAAPRVGAEADSDAVATFEGGHITRADLESVIARKLPQQRALIAREGAGPVLESLIRWELLVKEAEVRGYNDNPRVQEAIKRKKAELLIEAATRVDPASLPADELARLKEQRKREFQRPRMRRATFVLVATRPEALALAAQLKHATREQFAQAAREQSIDPGSRSQGGELGYFDEQGNTEKGQPAHALPELTKAAFTLKHVGDVTAEPIALKNGFAVLMLTGEMPPFVAPPGQVDDALREQLVSQKQNAALEALVTQLRNASPPVVHPELVDQIVLPEAEPLGIPEGFPAAPPDPREPPKLVAPDRY